MALPSCLHGQERSGTNYFDPSFAHVVYFWLNHPDDPGDRTKFETALRELFQSSAYTRTHFIGTPPRATREVVDDSFTYAMIVTFESPAAQAAYQSEQAHLEFIDQTAHLIKRIVVYDAEGIKP